MVRSRRRRVSMIVSADNYPRAGVSLIPSDPSVISVNAAPLHLRQAFPGIPTTNSFPFAVVFLIYERPQPLHRTIDRHSPVIRAISRSPLALSLCFQVPVFYMRPSSRFIGRKVPGWCFDTSGSIDREQPPTVPADEQ